MKGLGVPFDSFGQILPISGGELVKIAIKNVFFFSKHELVRTRTFEQKHIEA